MLRINTNKENIMPFKARKQSTTATRTAAVVIFDDVTAAEAAELLKKIEQVVSADVREYDDRIGDPVFYIP